MGLRVYEYPTCIDVDVIQVDEQMRGLGIGTSIMTRIVAYSEAVQKPMVLFASSELGGDVEALKRWYQSLGFIECNDAGFEHDAKYNMVRYITREGERNERTSFAACV